MAAPTQEFYQPFFGGVSIPEQMNKSTAGVWEVFDGRRVVGDFAAKTVAVGGETHPVPEDPSGTARLIAGGQEGPWPEDWSLAPKGWTRRLALRAPGLAVDNLSWAEALLFLHMMSRQN